MSSDDPYDLSEFLLREVFRTFCGNAIGRGVARTVFEHNMDPCLVVKVEAGNESFQNIAEWQVWQVVKGTEHAKWFAPCMHISPCGTVLVQRKTTLAANHPEKIPAFFTDCKLTNFGILIPKKGEKGGQFVCHDYGLHMLMERGMTKRMVRARWWNV